jgi:hypothetical protein
MIKPSYIQTPIEYFKQILDEDYRDFIEAPPDLRRAFHLAASLFHLRDWVAKAEPLTKKQLSKLYRRRSFRIIRDVANASKHLELNEPSTSVRGAGDIHLRDIGTAGYGIAGAYGCAGAYGPVLAIVVMPEGIAFAKAATEAYEMWKEFFRENGWDS